MTVVLGSRENRASPTTSQPGARSGKTWEERRRHYHAARRSTAYASWEPVPVATPTMPVIRQAPVPDLVRPGLMLLYASRMAHSRVDPGVVRRSANDERILVGEYEDAGVSTRALAVVRAQPVGRSTSEHYQSLHQGVDLDVGRLLPVNTDAFRNVTAEARRAIAGAAAFPGAFLEGVRIMSGVSGSSHTLTRTGASRRALVAVLAAILVLASFASTGFAQQYRYTVQSGDTIESIANDFDVNPDAIRASSYLPNGDALSAGQVIIIPESGQSPTDAAQEAAANEGTSPWVAAVYWVEDGDNPASIAGMYGVDLSELLEFNDIDDPYEIIAGTKILIPGNGERSGSSGSSAVTVGGVPDYKQQRNLSCEYAATYAAAMAFGWGPTEADFMAQVPNALNPHYGYRGNIDGWWGNTRDYGIYAEPLVPVLNAWGFEGEVMYTFGDVGPLTEHLDAGHPVVTWLGFWGDTRERRTDEGNYSVFAGMHVVTVYGYDDDGVWVMDPAKGAKMHYSWDYFVGMWSVIDGMSLAVYPS